KVLIIDDEDDVRERIRNILQRRGHTVFTAGDGQEGLDILKKEEVDIVYCDIVMPNMDGIEFMKRVKEFNLKTEFIMVTGCSTVDRCVESIEQNACGYLIKPLNVEDILKNLSEAERRIEQKREMLKRALSAKEQPQQ
ncbi:MAG: response regulator, partial [Candidatus Omnitrophica bacterium]|nr:response regulator [Candidatus Omnitrophota bacterium]